MMNLQEQLDWMQKRHEKQQRQLLQKRQARRDGEEDEDEAEEEDDEGEEGDEEEGDGGQEEAQEVKENEVVEVARADPAEESLEAPGASAEPEDDGSQFAHFSVCFCSLCSLYILSFFLTCTHTHTYHTCARIHLHLGYQTPQEAAEYAPRARACVYACICVIYNTIYRKDQRSCTLHRLKPASHSALFDGAVYEGGERQREKEARGRGELFGSL